MHRYFQRSTRVGQSGYTQLSAVAALRGWNDWLSATRSNLQNTVAEAIVRRQESSEHELLRNAQSLYILINDHPRLENIIHALLLFLIALQRMEVDQRGRGADSQSLRRGRPHRRKTGERCAIHSFSQTVHRQRDEYLST